MKFYCIEENIKKFFFNYGGFIARHPLWFLFSPMLLAGVLGVGISFITSDQSVENLYTPENGQAKTDRKTVEELFTQHGDNDTLVTRLTSLGRSGKVIIQRQDGGNVLTETVFKEIRFFFSLKQNNLPII